MKFGITRRNKEIGSEMDVFKKNISNLFDDFFSLETTGFNDWNWAPAIDVVENKKEIHVKAELPGLEEKDINVQVEGDVLTISGEKKEERREESKEKNYLFCERTFGSFSRSIRLPEGVKTDEINARFKNGVLEIDIPREKVEETKKIKIELKN